MNARGALREPVLMVVHAHPDDESSQTGGTLARYAASGCRTVLITCTDGAQGDASDGGGKPGAVGHDPRLVAAFRARELDAATGALGVHDVVTLGYPDSGMEPDGGAASVESFSGRPMAPMVEQMVQLVRRYQPDVILTYPPNGLSGHPDHVRTHDLVVAAHGDVVANAEPDSTGAALRVPRLYYIAMSVSRLREAQASVRAAFGDDAWAPPEGMGVDDAEITTVIDVTSFWEEKLRALGAHASQPDAAMLLKLFSAAAKSVVHVEEYVRAYPPAELRGGSVEDDFFG